MVTTFEIAPAPALAPFVRCYTYREFNTYGMDVIKPWHAAHELYIIFFLGDIPKKTVTKAGKIIYGIHAGLIGTVTTYAGDMTMNGNYSFITIQFKPNGFSKLFRLPCFEFTNNIIDVNDLLDNSIKFLHEQLLETDNLWERAGLLDKYLLSFLNKQRFIESKDAISCIAGFIIKKAGFVNVQQLAYDANMSVRNFERHFNDQVGTSPKLFCRVTRFSRALDIKLKYPYKQWTSIAQETGYFDQMHLIKDCKEFTGSSPSVFVKETPLLEKDFTNRLGV